MPDAEPSSELLWSAIDEARARAEAEPERLADRLDEILRRMSGGKRAQILAQLTEQLDRADHWDLLSAAIELERDHPSARAFLELRLWLVAQGRTVFEQALREPACLAELIAAGRIGGGYYRELGVLLRHHRSYASVLDGHEGDEPAAASRGTPPDDRSAAEPSLGEMLREMSRRLSSLDGGPRLWLLRFALLSMLVGSVAVILRFGWWALLLVPALLVLGFAVTLRGSGRLAALAHLRRARAMGSAKVLHGHQRYEIHFDVSAPSEETVARTRARVEVALAWIRDQAAAYDQSVSFECAAIEHGISDRPLTVAANGTPERAHLVELRRSVRRRIASRTDDRQPAFVLVFIDDDHRACAWVSHGTGDDPLELGVCPVDAWPGTIAHETLHLFGAQDLYFDNPTTHDRKQAEIAAVHHVLEYASTRLASWTITRSIMRLSRHPHAVVDPLTAHSVGWLGWPRGLPRRLRTPWADET